MQFVGANTVLPVPEVPDSRKPFLKADRRILNGSTNLDAELPLTNFTLPDSARR